MIADALACATAPVGPLAVLAGTLTPVIAVLTVYIAWQQYQVNRRGLKLSLYEKRFAVYRSLRTLLAAAVAHADVSNAEEQVFLAETKEADFLFEAAIPEYLLEVYRKANELHALSFQLAGSALPVGAQRNNVVVQHRAAQDWLGEQPAAAAKLFSPYLDFRKAW